MNPHSPVWRIPASPAPGKVRLIGLQVLSLQQQSYEWTSTKLA